MVTRCWTYGVTDSEEGEDGGQDGSAVFRSGDRHAVQWKPEVSAPDRCDMSYGVTRKRASRWSTGRMNRKRRITFRQLSELMDHLCLIDSIAAKCPRKERNYLERCLSRRKFSILDRATDETDSHGRLCTPWNGGRYPDRLPPVPR